MRLAVVFSLLAVAGAAHDADAAHNDMPKPNKEYNTAKIAAARNRLRGRPASASTQTTATTTSTRRRRRRHRHLQTKDVETKDEPGITKWDNNRISPTNPDGVPLDAEDKPDCWPSCYSHHYDGPVNVGGNVGVGNVGITEVNRLHAVDVPSPPSSSEHKPAENDAVEQAALQLALAEAQALTAARGNQIVYDYSTGQKYDLSTGQKIVVEEVEHANVSTGQERVDVKVYVVEGLSGTAMGPGSGPLDDPTPFNSSNNNSNNGLNDGDAALPLDDPPPPKTCFKPRDDETCTHNSQCESGCCATLATKTKCVEPRWKIFKQYCPVANPCRDDAESKGTMVPKVAKPVNVQGIPTGVPQDKETDTGGAMYTVGSYTTIGGDPSHPSNPNRVVDGSSGAGAGSSTTASTRTQSPPPVDCSIEKKDNWPINQFPQADQCQGSCQCKSGCCVGYGRQICIDKTANEGRWADRCI